MKKLTFFFVVALLYAITSCKNQDFSNNIPAVEQTQFTKPPKNLRDYRYGEVIPIFQNSTTIYIEVYNTIGLNELPAEQWEKLNAEELAESYGAKMVRLNGPRYWVLNSMRGSGKTVNGKTVDFEGIEMTLRATLEFKIWDGSALEEHYSDNEVNRETIWMYHKGNMVYELTNPDGEIYRMQSYSQEIDPTLSIRDLEKLQERLQLPKGWSYHFRILEENSELNSNGKAYVITDDLNNTYQKINAH
ncbi:hypothetical protein [Aquimarina sp. MMG016]|uniref:hypothetical protein n=1 Tax=Aquimarina sp. MMG016 TaxID=2822690 RepID=UPI001B39D328|nr:hypothetical protein [Aquimarina sp. MMG016]MBQ4821673.1 hypothetical protein [Aquimarina sp. MMG016]